MDDETLERLREAKRKLRKLLGHRAGISGFGVGDGCVRVYLSREGAREELPETIDDIPIEIVVTGEIKAYSV